MRYSKIHSSDRTPALAVLNASASTCWVALGETAKMFQTFSNITSTDSELYYKGKINPTQIENGIYPVDLLRSLRAAVLRLDVKRPLTYSTALEDMRTVDEALAATRSFDTVMGMFDEQGLLIGKPAGFRIEIRDHNDQFLRGFYIDSFFVVDTGIGKAFGTLLCSVTENGLKTTPVLEDVQIDGDFIRRKITYSPNHLGKRILSESFSDCDVSFQADCGCKTSMLYAMTNDVHGLVCYRLVGNTFQRDWQIIGTESFSSAQRAQKRGMELALRSAVDGRVTDSMATAAGFYLKAASTLASRSILKTSTALDEGTSLLAKLQAIDAYYSRNKIETSEELGEILGTLTRVANGCARTQVTEFTNKFMDRLKHAYLLRYSVNDGNQIWQDRQMVYSYNSAYSKSLVRKVSAALTGDPVKLRAMVATKKPTQTKAITNAAALSRGTADALAQAEATAAQYRIALQAYDEKELAAALLQAQRRVEQAEAKIVDAGTISSLATAGAKVIAAELAKFLALPVVSGVWGGSLGCIGDLVNIKYPIGAAGGSCSWKRDLATVPFEGMRSVEIEYSCQGTVQAQRGDCGPMVTVYGGCNPDKGDYQKTKVVEKHTCTLNDKMYSYEPVILISPEIVRNLGFATAYPVRQHEVKILTKYTIDRDCKKITVWDNNYAYPVGLTLTQFRTFVIAVITDLINRPAFKLAGVGAAAMQDAAELLSQVQRERAELVTESIRRERLMELYSEAQRRVRYFKLLGTVGTVGESNRTIAYPETKMTGSTMVADALSDVYSRLSVVDVVDLGENPAETQQEAAKRWRESELVVRFDGEPVGLKHDSEVTLNSGLYNFVFKVTQDASKVTLTPSKVEANYSGTFEVVMGGKVINLTQLLRIMSEKRRIKEDIGVLSDAMQLFSDDDLDLIADKLPITPREREYIRSLKAGEQKADFVSASRLLAFVILLDDTEAIITSLTAMGESRAISELTEPTNFALGLALTERFM